MATFTNLTKSGNVSIAVGNPIGLLLALTYAAASSSEVPWTNGVKHSATFTNLSKS